MSRIRQLGRETLVYGVSSIFSRFLNFLLVPFYTHVLSPELFGVLNSIFILLAFLNIVYQAGFDVAYLRLGSDATAEGRKSLFSTAMWSHVSAVAVLSCAFLLARPLWAQVLALPEAHRGLLTLACLIIALDTLSVVPFAHLRMVHKAFWFAGTRLVNVLVNIGCNLLFLLVFDMGLQGILWANVAASAVSLLLLSPVVAANLRALFTRSSLVQLAGLGLPLVPAGLYGMVNEMAGRWFLLQLDGPELERLYPGRDWSAHYLVGIFSAAWKLGVFGLLLAQMYRMAWQPFFMQRSKDPDAARIFGRILRYFLLFLGTATLPIVLFLDYLVAIPIMGRHLIAPEFWTCLPIVPVVLAAYGLEAWYVHFTAGIYIAKKSRHMIWINGAGAAVTLVANFLLIPRLGLWGAAWAALLCYLTMAVLITWQSQRLFTILLEKRRLAAVALWLVSLWAVGTYLQLHREAWPLAWRFGLLAAFLVVPILSGGVKPGELKKAFSRPKKAPLRP